MTDLLHAPTGRTADTHAGHHSRLRDGWPLTRADLGWFLLASLSLIAVFSAVGKLIVGPLDGSIGDGDRRIARWFVDHRTPRLDGWSHWGSMLSETAVKIVITGVAIVVMVAVWKRWNEALLVGAALALEASVFLTTTLIVGRHRPPVPKLEGSPVDSSFPSGHVAAAVVYAAFAIIVARHSSRRWPAVLTGVLSAAVAVIVAWARMYRGMHHLSDVIAGAVLGLASVVVTWLIVRHAERRRAAIDAAPHPAAGELP
ncbi:MAG: phosphatase PAP2 family protein [Acidimicrobiales bacterium]